MVYEEDKKVEILARIIADNLEMSAEEAMDLIYEEWDLIEPLIDEACNTCDDFIVEQLNEIYKIA